METQNENVVMIFTDPKAAEEALKLNWTFCTKTQAPYEDITKALDRF